MKLPRRKYIVQFAGWEWRRFWTRRHAERAILERRYFTGQDYSVELITRR